MNRVLSLTIDREPTDLSIEELASLLNLLANALHAADPDASSKYSLSYSLVDIGPGSTALDYVANNSDIGDQQAKKMTQQMADPVTRRKVKPYRNFQDKCNELGTTIAIYTGGSAVPALRLVPEPPTEEAYISGGTTIYGVLEKVGGTSKVTANIKQVGAQRLTSVDIDKKLAKEMAQHLYQEVRLDGEAKWDPSTLEMVSFKANTFVPHDATAIIDTLDKLAQTVGPGKWHDTGQTIEEYLCDLRGGSGERT